jgi:hypothetical protein
VTEAPPEPAETVTPEPEAPGGPLTHIEQWIAKHVAPDIADIRIKAGTALAAAQKALPVLEKVAALLEEAVKAGTLPAEIITRAETVAAEAASVAADLAAFGL